MQICRNHNSKQTAAPLGDVHTNWSIWMLAKSGIFGSQVFVQTPLRARSHLGNSQLDACPDFCACRIEARGLRVMIQTQLHCLSISGFLSVNTDKVVLQSESGEASTCLKIQSGSWGEFCGLQAVLPPSLPLPLAQLWVCCWLFTSERLQWPMRSSSTSHSQRRIVLYICFKNASEHSLHPNESTEVSWKWWGNSNKRVGQCKAIPASAGQKSSSHCSEFS